MKAKRSVSLSTAVVLAAFVGVLIGGLALGAERWPVLLDIGVPLLVILTLITLIIRLVRNRSTDAQPAAERPDERR